MRMNNNPTLDVMKYSFSSVSSFETCPYGFKLTYLDAVPRESNFFSVFGSYCHDILEKFFRGELEVWDLADYYEENYTKFMTIPPPPYPAGMGSQYFDDGLFFFENFEFDKDKYEILLIEDKIELKHKDFSLVIKPDLILKNKETGKLVLLDYKTSKLKGNKYDDKKMEDYKRQFYLYVFFYWIAKGIEIDKIFVWFIRNNQFKEIPIDRFKMQETIEWFENGITKIKNEMEWKANTDKSNNYFCSFLCSVKNSCIYKQGT